MDKRNVLITGALGYIGREVLKRLSDVREEFGEIVAMDIREPAAEQRLDGITYVTADIRDKAVARILQDHRINAVVHLAAIVNPPKKSNRQLEYEVDVDGTRNLMEGCIAAKVKQVIFTSSGAAYGYHADNAAELAEGMPLRGNEHFAYSWHKRLVEEMLHEYRQSHPDIKQLIFRVGTVLGATTNNMITRLFEKPVVIGVRGTDSPWVFIWDEDVVACIVKGLRENREGVFNLCGDGTVKQPEIAKATGRPFLPLPIGLIRGVLTITKRLGLSQYGPDQVDFIRYRPVLTNTRLKKIFGYTPQKTSREAFDYWLANRASRK
jgi:UDP-glucose 4-epimerase